MSTTQNNTNMDITKEEKQPNLSLDVADSDRVKNNSTGLDPSLSLDNEDEKEEIIYARHVNDDQIFPIPYSAAVHSGLIKNTLIDQEEETNGETEDDPFIITDTVTIDAFYFGVNYMLFNKGKKHEKPAPKPPINNSLSLKTILGDEYELFEKFDKLKIAINDYITMSLFMQFKELHVKLCAIMAYKIFELSEKLVYFIEKMRFECDNKEEMATVLACIALNGDDITADKINDALNASNNKVTPDWVTAFTSMLEGDDISIFFKDGADGDAGGDAGAADTAAAAAP